MKKNENCYMSDICKISRLSLEEEKALAAKAFSGDKNAQDKLVEANLRFVVKIAQQYQGYMELDDLIMEGNFGLMHAAKKFNPNNKSNAKFSTYAAWWIKAYIQKAIREQATGIKFPATKYEEMKDEKWQMASLDKSLLSSEGETTTFGSLLCDDSYLSPEDQLIFNDDNERLYAALDMLNETERTIIINRYGLNGDKPMSLAVIGEIVGYSKERVRQLEIKTVRKLNMLMEMDDDQIYQLAA